MSETGADQRVLAVERVLVAFGKLVAVRNVTFSLNTGHLLGLIGPNGSGKTTLLRTIAGLQSRLSGSVRVLGRELQPGELEVLRFVGFAPDTPPFYEMLTVRDFLRFIGRGYRLAPQDVEERIDFWLEKVWLKEKADQKIKGLSRGMRQRVGIARTLLPNPAIVLLDEPAAGLDPAGRVQFRQLLCDLRSQGKVLIVSSHILSDLEEYCTHIGIMQRGEMVQFDTVANVASGADASRCRYRIELAREFPMLVRVLEGISGVTAVRLEGERAELEFESGRPAAARLLSELVQRSVPVASFTPLAPDIEQAYLRAGIGQVD